MQGHAYVGCDETRVIRLESDPKFGYEDVNPDGKEVGEIVFRGNMVMKGEFVTSAFCASHASKLSRFFLALKPHTEYYNDEAATAKAFEGGWFHTGDLAVREPHGAMSIQDRSKDIIISGGENASSLAIESALFEHPDILEVAVVARPHEQYGERAMAYVILKSDCSEKWKGKGDEFQVELIEFSRSRLPGE